MQKIWHPSIVYFKSGKSIKDELVAPKDKDHITKKSGIIYRFKCDRLECDEEYIGETARTFGERFKEHLKAPSPIYDHSNTTGHSTTLDSFSMVGREEQTLSRLIKKSMFIRVYHNGSNISHSHSGYSTCHSQKYHLLSQMWFHLPQQQQQQNVAISSATMAKIISHITTTWQRTSANNIKW